MLLDKFGAGGHKPGSGSAAALMGILSGKLIVTVCKLSRRKPRYRHRKREFDHVVFHIETILEGQLRQLFQRDAEVFASVINARIARDASKDVSERRVHRKAELDLLREGTEIPREIGGLCLKLIDYAVFTFDVGFHSARGDSGAALSAAIAGASSAAFVMNLNLRSFPGLSAWKISMRESIDDLLRQLQEKQAEAFTRVMQLTERDIGEWELHLGTSVPNA
jgi:formiminotetrahydrofolate cyclodeaminase